MKILNKLINNSTIINGNIFPSKPGSVGGVQLLLKLLLEGGTLSTNEVKEGVEEAQVALADSTYHFTTVALRAEDLYEIVTFSHITLEDGKHIPGISTLVTTIGIMVAEEANSDRIRMKPTYYADYLTSSNNKAVIVPTYDGYRFHKIFS